MIGFNLYVILRCRNRSFYGCLYRAQDGINPLAVIDLSQEDSVVVQKLNIACRDVGFFYCVHHGVPLELIDKV